MTAEIVIPSERSFARGVGNPGKIRLKVDYFNSFYTPFSLT
jgi:hypothetical protein